MNYYLGVTDIDWFNFLASRKNEDVNFWQPGGNIGFQAIKQGEPFLFKLKSPYNAIAGLGFFSSFSRYPIEVAWDFFQERNGVSSFYELKRKITTKRSAENSFASNPHIGCIILTDPIFLPQSEWIQVPPNWSSSIQKGKTYNLNDEIGKALWKSVEQKLGLIQFFERLKTNTSQLILSEPESQYSQLYLSRVRLGQGAFRALLSDSYSNSCAISGERTLPALEAAHIQPYSENGPHYISNGLLLRADLHKLFDSGYITLNSSYKIEVSRRIKEEFENGKEYYKFNGQSLLILPKNIDDRPNINFVEWHNNYVYNG